MTSSLLTLSSSIVGPSSSFDPRVSRRDSLGDNARVCNQKRKWGEGRSIIWGGVWDISNRCKHLRESIQVNITLIIGLTLSLLEPRYTPTLTTNPTPRGSELRGQDLFSQGPGRRINRPPQKFFSTKRKS